jgi:hypothetical protein
MTYDDARQRVVLFGGETDPASAAAPNNETWIWNGTNWSGPFATAGMPPRESINLAFDSARQQAVVFGGQGSNTVLLSDTWVWNGTSWANKCGGGAVSCGVAARSGYGMTYDSVRQRVVMFGGTFGAAFPNAGWAINETWEWDGASWTAVCGNASKPACAIPAMINPSMAFDPVRKRVVLYGGETYSGDLSSVWEYDGTAWTVRTDLAVLPPSRKLARMEYDATRGLLVLFGGRSSGPPASDLNDTWEFDGNCWKNATATGTPTATHYFMSAYDIARAKFLVFGGYDDSTSTLAHTLLAR